MIQTYTSDHHLTLELDGELVTGDYKGYMVAGKIDAHLEEHFELLFSDLNRQRNNVAALKSFISGIQEYLPEDVAKQSKELLRSTH